MSFVEKLSHRVKEADSLLCVGLDPHPDDLVEPTAASAREFCFRMIQATSSVAAAFKPNIAFFEAFGVEGISVLHEVIATIPDEIPIILDAKRGDIASSAEAYARSVFTILGADAVTINPYLGFDSIEPFLNDPERGVFLLCKTSNPGAADIQDLLVLEHKANHDDGNALLLYEEVARLALGWNSRGNLGLVVGATYPGALQRVRRLAPDLWILVPGIGAQGGDLFEAVQAGLRQDGMGILITVSRGISRSTNLQQAAEDFHQRINIERRKVLKLAFDAHQKKDSSSPSIEFTQLADGLLDAGCIKFGQFTLKSGIISPIYIDLRRLVSYPKLLEQAARAYLSILNGLSFDRLAGLPYAALPIATAICIHGGWPMIYPRKEIKTYGTRAEIEGVYHPGERIAVIDDLATTGGSKLEAIEKLSAAGLKVDDIVVLIDRQSGALESLSSAGYKLHAVTTLTKLLDYYEKSGKVLAEDIKATREFLKKNQ